jgi:hypothetical protein
LLQAFDSRRGVLNYLWFSRRKPIKPTLLTTRSQSLANCEPGSSVSIVYGYGLDDWAIEVRSPAEAKGLFV